MRKILPLIAALVFVAGCGAWKAEKLEATTAGHIDSRLSSNMALDDFRNAFPDAERISGDDQNGAWFVSVQDICFWCRTREGFERSRDVYARVVHFEDGELARIEPSRTAR